MNNILIIARKECKDALHSRLFIVILVLLIGLAIVSVSVASLLYKDQVDEYDRSVKALEDIGQAPTGPPPVFSPLTLLRGLVDYLEIIGAVLGILLGYISIAKEKNKRTLRLLLTRPVARSEIIYGKILGNAIMITAIMVIVSAITLVGLGVAGGTLLSVTETLKFGIVILLSIAYILIFFCLTTFVSLTVKKPSTALMICFVIWLIVVLIIPQIGDTMDPDNQVPGGFFKSMGLTRPQEKEVIAHFNTYETIRDRIEQMSITKHYERASFGLLGIKPEFNDRSINYIMEAKYIDVLWVVAPLAALVIANQILIYRKDTLTGGM